MSTSVHFEIPADDIGRAKDFYSKLFGWEIKDTSLPGMEYWSITTSGENPVHGGMMKREAPQQQIINYVDVPSVADYVAKIQELGGRVLVPKTAVPGIGYFAVFMDTENNTLGIWHEDKEAK